MSVRRTEGSIRLEGRCGVEDAEPLLRFLLETDQRVVDISAADHLHTAVLQVLMASQPRLEGGDPFSFARQWVLGAGKPSEDHYNKA